MKKFIFPACALALVLTSACVQSSQPLTLAAVGPAPLPAPTVTGSLVVYSAYDTHPSANMVDENDRRYTDYKIYTDATERQLVKSVDNRADILGDSPATVELPPGRYLVEALWNGHGSVNIPVVIAMDRTTIIHLEGGSPWPANAGFTDANAVRLPNGQIIGWRANDMADSGR
jgi:hypothetical protein